MATIRKCLLDMALISSAFFIAEPSVAQSQSVVRRTAVLAVLEDYPVFRPSDGQARAPGREIRALVVRRDPAASDRSLILLNPAFVDASTLNDALNALRACPPADKSLPTPNFLIVGPPRTTRILDATTSVPLSVQLAKLRAQTLRHHGSLGKSGRSLTVDGVSVCLPTS